MKTTRQCVKRPFGCVTHEASPRACDTCSYFREEKAPDGKTNFFYAWGLMYYALEAAIACMPDPDCTSTTDAQREAIRKICHALETADSV